MSWFSNRFSASFRSPEGLHGDSDGDQEDDQTHGKGVKEDLSELTKTFTRQLWGVVSFLAPPPQTKPEEESDDGQEEAPMASLSVCHIQPDLQIDPLVSTGEMTLSHELLDVDFQASMDDALEGSAEGSKEETLNLSETLILHQSSEALTHHQSSDMLAPNQSSEHGLTGIGKDLAELKGSVATGFSRMLRVVREEIERDEPAKHYNDGDGDDDDDDDDAFESSVHARKLPVFNSLLRPLISSILHDDQDEALKKKRFDARSNDEKEEEGDDDDPVDLYGHQISRPPRAFDLQGALGLGGILKLTSSLFPVSLDSDDEHDKLEKKRIQQAVGVTEEVLVFARNVSMHPETWLDFPLFTDDDEEDEFEMSNAQKEHVYEVELASPRLAALRIELCPDYMSEGLFWKIYFVLLHSRLSKTDAVLLSTPQILEAQALLLRKLQKGELQGSKNKKEEQSGLQGKDAVGMLSPFSGTAESFKIVSLQSAMEVPANDFDQNEYLGANQGRPQTSGLINNFAEEVQNKNVLASTVKLAALNYEEEEADADRWLDEEPSPHVGSSATGLGNDDDVSFSDLEEDDDSLTSKAVGSSNSKRSYGWVQLNKNQGAQELEGLGISGKGKSEGTGHGDAGASRVSHGQFSGQVSRKQDRGESSDWLTVEEYDVASADFT